MTINWTTEPPTKVGAYWWKEKPSKPDDNAYLAIVRSSGQIEIHCDYGTAYDWGGLWCGPLVPEPVGIVGKLVEAGTLEGMDGFHGLLIEVPVEDLRKAGSVPLYRKVMVVEVAHE